MRVLLVILSVGLYFSSYAQFFGGKGDGFASVEVQIELTGLATKQQSVNLYPTSCEPGGKLFFDSGYDHIYLLDVTGEKIEQKNVSKDYFYLSKDLSSGVYVVVFELGNDLFYERIVVHD